jgi:hypothetical protein
METPIKARSPKTTPQWEHVRKARQRIGTEYPIPDALEEAWETLSSLYAPIRVGGKDYPVIDRETLEQTSDSPLSTLMFFTEMGFYPPPELLLGLLYSWREYLEGAGKKTLEEAFIGKPKRKGGNYSNQQTKAWTRMFLSTEFFKLIDEGLTQSAAAEKITDRYQLDIDPESLIRIAQKTPSLLRLRKNNGVKNPGTPAR